MSLLRESAVDRELSEKLGLRHLGHRQTMQTQIRCRKTRRLIRACTVCFNYSKLNINWNSSPRLGLFLQPTLRDTRPTSAASALIVWTNGSLLRGVGCVLSCSLSYCYVWWILWSSCCGRGSCLLCFPSVRGLCSVCQGLFALPLGVIVRLCSVIASLPDHLPHYVSLCLSQCELENI